MPSPLNARQTRFVAEYIKSGNATQSAIAAGYSSRTAAEQGSRLLTNVKIVNALASSVRNQGVTVERVIREAARLAFLNPQDFYDADGRMLSIKEMPEDAARAIAGIEELDQYARDESGEFVHTGVLKKIRLSPKVAALELLARNLGMLHDAPTVAVGMSIHLHLGGE